MKYTEKQPRIFQFTDVKTGAKGKVPSEVIQKINFDSEIDERKSYFIPESRPPKESVKNKRQLALSQWKMSLPLSIFPFPTRKKEELEGKSNFSVSIHRSPAGMSTYKGNEHREHLLTQSSPAEGHVTLAEQVLCTWVCQQALGGKI